MLCLKHQNELDEVLKRIIDDWEIPGLAVGVVSEQGWVYESYYGVQNQLVGAKISDKSLFCIASVSKVFVAFEIMKLHSEKLINIDDLVLCYIPDFIMNDSNHKNITIRMILNHTSGIPDLSDFEYDTFLSNFDSDDLALIKHIKKTSCMNLLFKPGEKFSYSNIGYDILGRIIEIVRGISFENAMKKDLLIPLEMYESTFLFSEIDHDKIAWPHLRAPSIIPSPLYPYNRGDSPASFLHSTLQNMGNFAKFCIANGSINGFQWLSKSLFDDMATSVVMRGFPPFYESAGLGWTIGHYENELVLSHGGMGFGWNDFFMVFPNKKIAAIILCNEESYSRARIIRAVADTIFEKKPQIGSLSWIMPINKAFEHGGKREMLEIAKNLINTKPENMDIDVDDLINVFYQILFSKKYDLANEYLDAIRECFPESLEIIDIKKELSSVKYSSKNNF